MKIVLLHPASKNEEWVKYAQELYLGKISPFVKIEIEDVFSKSLARSADQHKKKLESEEILKKITEEDFVILFDERGKDLDSIQFSKSLERAFSSSKKRIVLLIGGAFGVDDDVKDRANLQIKLGSMVMNHLVARVVVLEQTYRALTILKNIPYHNV